MTKSLTARQERALAALAQHAVGGRVLEPVARLATIMGYSARAERAARRLLARLVRAGAVVRVYLGVGTGAVAALDLVAKGGQKEGNDAVNQGHLGGRGAIPEPSSKSLPGKEEAAAAASFVGKEGHEGGPSWLESFAREFVALREAVSSLVASLAHRDAKPANVTLKPEAVRAAREKFEFLDRAKRDRVDRPDDWIRRVAADLSRDALELDLVLDANARERDYRARCAEHRASLAGVRA